MQATTSTDNSGPTQDAARIDSLDVLRGFALLGILVMNIQSFSMPSSAYLIPSSYESLEGANFLVWLVSALFFDLKFMAMFSMLFGAGIVLMSQHRDASDQPVLRVHYRRMCLLLIFGLIHAYIIWYGDILVAYALCGCWVVWLRRWRARWLVMTGAIFLVLGSGLYTSVGLGNMYVDGFAEEMGSQYAMTAADQQNEIDAYRASWSEHFPHRMEEALSMHFFVLPFMFFWRISGLMLLGMALFKLDILNASRSNRFYITMATVGGIVGIPLVAYGAYQGWNHNFEPQHALGFDALPNYFGSIGVALMWIALVMLMCRSAAWKKVREVLACYGRMAFTNYIGQSVLATLIFYGYGLGLFGSVSRIEQFGIVVAIWTVQLTLSPIWLRYFRFGPLEWVWRSGVYVRLQPMRR